MSSFDLYLVLVCVAIALTKGVSISALLVPIVFFLFVAFHPSYRLFMVMVIAEYLIINFLLRLHLTNKISLNGDLAARLSFVDVEEN